MGAAPADYSGEPTRSSDPAMIYFTSGTVGYPKMVLHTHASYPIGHVITGNYWLDLTPDDLHWNAADNGWAKAAWSSLFGPWNMGAALFVQDARGKFNAAETLQLLARYPITTFCAPPTAYRMLVLEDLTQYHFPSLRRCVGRGRAAQPRGDRGLARGDRADHPRRLRPDRDGADLSATSRRWRCSPARWASRRRASTWR